MRIRAESVKPNHPVYYYGLKNVSDWEAKSQQKKWNFQRCNRTFVNIHYPFPLSLMLYELDNFCALNSIRWDRANPREMFFSRCLFWFFFRQKKKEQEGWSLVIGYWSLVKWY